MKHISRETASADEGYIEFDFHDDPWADQFGVFFEAGYMADGESGRTESATLVEIPRKQARKFAKALLKATKKRSKNG